jgi:hypothetical protein
MLQKNVAGQPVYFVLINAATGGVLPSAVVTAWRALDGGIQTPCDGSVVEDGNGQYHLMTAQADTNGNILGFLFTAPNAVPVSIMIVTTACNPTDPLTFGMRTLQNLGGGGPITVTQDYGGTDNLSYRGAFGEPISGGTVLAYLASDYAAGNLDQSFLVGKTTTVAGGRWATPMQLTAGQTYTLVYSVIGRAGSDLRTLTT